MLSRFWVMSVNWLKIGPYIEQSTVRNTDCQYGEFDAIGVNIGKEILPMRGNISEKDFSNFFLVPPRHFAYNPRGSRKLGLRYNATPNTYIITFNDVVFRVKPEAESVILPEFLFLYLSRKEWDRKAEYLSWGSSTEVFSWETLCDVEIPAPSIKKQRELVATWKGLRDMKEQNEAMAAPLMQLCQSRLQELKHKYPLTEIGPYIEQCDERNSENVYGIDSVMGVSIAKKFIPTKADMGGVSLTPYKLVRPNEFCYVTVTSRNGGKISLALNQSEDTYIVSSSYEVFKVIDDTPFVRFVLQNLLHHRLGIGGIVNGKVPAVAQPFDLPAVIAGDFLGIAAQLGSNGKLFQIQVNGFQLFRVSGQLLL